MKGILLIASIALCMSVSSAQFYCPEEGVHFFQHSSRCDRYYMCFGGIAIERSCAPDFHYSEAEEFCTWPSYAECTLETSLCPEVDDPEDLVWIPSQADCGKYYVCHRGETHALQCGPGLWFNPETTQCDFPENVQCDVEPTPAPEPEPEIEIECPSDNGFYFVPHPKTCEYYFICVDGDIKLLNCAPGLFWDTSIDRCNKPELAVCEILPSPQPL